MDHIDPDYLPSRRWSRSARPQLDALNRDVARRAAIARVAQASAWLRDTGHSVRQAPPDSTTAPVPARTEAVSTTTVSGSQWLLPA